MKHLYRKVVIAKPDLDTCLTALIMGVNKSMPVRIAPAGAEDAELLDSRILCIEAGGTGLIHLGNFDHHDPGKDCPPACRQAFDLFRYPGYELDRLVNYVCLVDQALPIIPQVPFPSLSSLFSGILLTVQDRETAFFKGIAMLDRVLKHCLSPFAPMPNYDDWQVYVRAKSKNLQILKTDLKSAKFMLSRQGIKIGWLSSQATGGSAELYRQDCGVAVLHSLVQVHPLMSKYTIAGKGLKVSGLLYELSRLEKGWGGRSSIIGSPGHGSQLTTDQVMQVVIDGL
ncbi:hypothetical protein [Desulfonatronovibrio hydrogenovorans]|uniref:hypothetical protein n=1 Tax=Desulfonatronovibrio hydrogenovorans TaxID=53245 RepID=UPI00048E60DB|nr:hypothetical protein [Desulfonatronovibrio hydrogenovorans]